MNKIFQFIEFFSRIEVQFFYFGKAPIEKSDMFSGLWDFKYFNGKSSEDFDQEIREFSNLIKLIEKELKEGTVNKMGGFTQQAIQFALVKTKELAKKVSSRNRTALQNRKLVWYFNDPVILKVAHRFSEENEEIKSYEDFPALISHVEELISEDVHWIKQCLDRLVPVLKSIISKDIVVERSIERENIVGEKIVEREGIAKAVSNPIQLSLIAPSPAKSSYNGPKNFISHKFKPEVIKVLLDKLIFEGFIQDKPAQRNSFYKLFSVSPADKWVTQINWQGDQTTLRGLIRFFDDFVKIANSKKFKWIVADKSFKVKGEMINFNKDTTNGHYGPNQYRKLIKNTLKNILLEYDELSEEKE